MERAVDQLSLTLPFLLDEKHHDIVVCKLEDDVDDPCAATTTSFFKTCFNGINALSGLLLLNEYGFIIITYTHMSV